MSQINYCLEIIKNLGNKENHIRGLAKELDTNQMMVSRKIHQLESVNVVDYKQEGKNKVYFLKNSLEAKQYLFISEHDRVLKTIHKYPFLKSIFNDIRQNNRVNLAVLFGSYAKGTAHNNSDIDIYIDTTSQELKKEVELINSRISVKIGRIDASNPLVKEIKKNHVIIKGVETYYEKIPA
ncbi:MAG: nucleotidyltransferase domain-containing protein [Candidatus Nanoarchaeia archaeon]